ncbi:hypothetical protein ONQ60_28250, partial [Salmonella enterica subsp. enterica serovar Virginia]|nr:hypothetical protein [Salmonella enterica subsp. enterica serovar Virginia]
MALIPAGIADASVSPIRPRRNARLIQPPASACAFQLCYTIAQPITGYLMDVIGLKIGFFIFALLWSLINMAHAL